MFLSYLLVYLNDKLVRMYKETVLDLSVVSHVAPRNLVDTDHFPEKLTASISTLRDTANIYQTT